MNELYGSLIAEKLIDERLANNLWDAGFQSIHSLLELPTDPKQLQGLLQLDCPTLQKIGVAYSLVAAIKKLRIGTASSDSVASPESPSAKTAPSLTQHDNNNQDLVKEPINEDREISDDVISRKKRIESALKKADGEIDKLREGELIKKYPIVAEELRLDAFSTAISAVEERLDDILDPIFQQYRSKTVEIEAITTELDQFEEVLMKESKLHEIIEFLTEAYGFLQDHFLDPIEKEGIPIVDKATTTAAITIALTLNIGKMQDKNHEAIKNFISSSHPITISHWSREPKALELFSEVVGNFVSLFRTNKSNESVRFVCTLCSDVPTDCPLSNYGLPIFVQLIESQERSLFPLPLSVHADSIVADEVTPSTMMLTWLDPQHASYMEEYEELRLHLIQGYQVFAQNEDDGTEELVCETKDGEDSCRVEALHQDTTYRFSIKTICAHDIQVERSDWSHPFRTKREERRALRVKDGAAKVPDHCSATVFHLSRKAVPLSGSGIQKFEIGAKSPKNIGKKVLLMVGGTGTGKTTLVNSMANYLYEVRHEDPFRFKLISEEDEAKECGTYDTTRSQTKLVGAYVLNDTRLNYQLTVIDTPGFGDTDEGAQFDRQTVAYIKSWFSQRGAEGISQIDGICIVVKSNDIAINARVRRELTSVVELFGKHMRQNVLVMLTFSDTARPPAIDALKNIAIPTDKAFKFNNSAVFEQYIEATEQSSIDDQDDARVRKVFWDMGMKSFHEFFKQLDDVPSGSLSMSLETLKVHEMLKQQVTSLNERMKDELEEAKNISETIEQLVKNKSAIDCNRNFVVKIKRHRAVKRPIGDSEKCALICLNCNFPCLKQCARTEALEIQLSVIMRRTIDQTKELLAESAASGAANASSEEQIRAQKESATCIVCPANCHLSAHAMCDYVIEREEIVVAEKISDLMDRYNIAIESNGESNTQVLAEKMAHVFVEKERELRAIVAEIRVRLSQLNEIDMTQQSDITDHSYFNMLIDSENASSLPGFSKRVAILERQLSALSTHGTLSADDANSAATLYLHQEFPQLYEKRSSNEQGERERKARALLHARNKGDDCDNYENPSSSEKLSPMKAQLKFWRDMGY